jgi:uncharacterized protein involved in exopolysaccharide biosynthesis
LNLPWTEASCQSNSIDISYYRDTSVENLRKELESLEKTLTNLLTQFTDQSQHVVKVRAQIAAVEESL